MSAQRPRRVRPPRWPAPLVPWRLTVQKIIEEICRRLNVPIEIVGATKTQGDGGDELTYTVTPGAAAAGVPTTNLTVYALEPGKFSITSGLVNGVAVKKDSVSGSAISNASPPSWTRSDGFIYLGLKWTTAYDRGSLSTVTGPVCFIASASSVPADNEGTGLFHIPLAEIEDDEIVNNYSPNKNLWAVVNDKGAGDSKVVPVIA